MEKLCAYIRIKGIQMNLGLALIFFLPIFPVFGSITTIADKIQIKIEANLYTFKPYVQSHYAIRMFRLTGNSKYLYPILFNQLAASIQYKNLVKNLKSNHGSLEDFSIDLTDKFNAMNKWEKRQYMINRFPEIKLELQLLYILSIASQLNLLDSYLYPGYEGVLQNLKSNSKQLKRFLLNPIVIKYASPSVANYVYNLKEMNIIDMTDEYQAVFQKGFNDQKDDLLSDAEYTEKIYGMTHIIIAASNYYQRKVSREKFNWIYNYFDAHIDEIISRLKYDVIIEVGVCYLLADKVSNQQSIEKIKKVITSRFDPKNSLINEPWDKNQVEKAEHRNILTILFLKWTGSLHPGPDLLNSKQFKLLMTPQAPL